MNKLRNRSKVLIVLAVLLVVSGVLGIFARGQFQFDMGASRGPLGPVTVQFSGDFGKAAERAQSVEARQTTIYVPVPGRTSTTDDERRMIAEYMKMQESLKIIEAQTRKQLEDAGTPLPAVDNHPESK